MIYMKERIGPFTRYDKKPNDIRYGSLYTLNVTLPVPYCQKRTIRVYLPDGYSEENRYPVMYMTDGQNIVDKYTTAYGAWDIDVREHQLIKEGYPPFIVVGIDCPRVGHVYRVREYTLQDVPIMDKHVGPHKGKEPYSDILMDYVVNIVKPMIDHYFYTLPQREFTAFGGSSMGGLAAFNYGTKCKETFGFALCFSPAFFLFDKKKLYDYVDSLNINPYEYGKFYFYSGDVEFEHQFIKGTTDMYHYFLKHGYDESNVHLEIDKTQKHCEAAWNKHFKGAIRFWLKEYKNK